MTELFFDVMEVESGPKTATRSQGFLYGVCYILFINFNISK
jgi:hypothetical protein